MDWNTLKKQYHIRPAGMDDAEIVANLFNQCSRHLNGRDEITADELRADWGMDDFDFAKSTVLVFNQGGNLIAYADLWGVSPPYVSLTTWVRVHPDYDHTEVKRLLYQFIEGRAREIMVQSPENAKVVLSTHTNAKDDHSMTILEQIGAKAIRFSWVMERSLESDIPLPEIPEGFSLRKALPSEMKQIYELDQACFKDHWGHVERPFEQGFALFKTYYVDEPFYCPDLWFLIEKENEMVGMVLGTQASSYGEDFGWVSLLGVKREFRQLGLGQALLYQAFGAIKALGSKTVGLSVDAQSLTGATRLYEKVGMTVSETYARFEKVLKDGEDLRTLEIS
jgi:ribosomal protein S18 acetylase RimI-like enzyme